jgi:hypothetical protein
MGEMKATIKIKLVTTKRIIMAVGLVLVLPLLHAQIAPFGISNNNLAPVAAAPTDFIDSIVCLTADYNSLPLLPAGQAPVVGTFWTIVNGPITTALPFPCPPPGGNHPTYEISPGIYLVDDTAGANPVTPADLEAQAIATANVIAQVQTAAAGQQMQAMMRAAGDGLPGVPGGGGTGGTDGWNGSINYPVCTTNDLWLQILGATNGTVGLVINTPWNVTDGVFDLFATTNLLSSTWQWLMRTAPGQTNLTATGLSEPNEFFVLGTMQPAADGSGLTTAYENLVSSAFSSDGYGTPNAWYLQNDLNPLTLGIGNQDPALNGLSNWQEYQYGTAPQGSTGFTIWVGTPNGMTSIP